MLPFLQQLSTAIKYRYELENLKKQPDTELNNYGPKVHSLILERLKNRFLYNTAFSELSISYISVILNDSEGS